ncbi:MAG: 50S ribosomal protein L31e [Methanosphaera sp.]|uniref:50S ribosomal protein L31e n=1 Tax=Methanosphaera sp. TaxID=2666342 RepID=UPI0025CEC244|nr:50S ribosomal protein L31e [Methanosphaera sp.]MCI5867866.1 50S ribosomal protein L31e [Methanosphaera sp.]MDD6534876.1 50S ribosomal protein L31e [Methanosphaera sp.]MDY3955336.1 50S ribosomal protein L31e [Methanosphaera sp.]
MERIYTIPLRDVKRVPRTKRSPKAMRYIREFIQKHMKVEDVVIATEVNEKIWERGREKIPSKIKVKAVEEDGTVEVLLADE